MKPLPSIRMGEMSVARDDGILRTLLGSCVGLALYDRVYRVAGLAHSVLPVSLGVDAQPGKFVDTAIPALVEEMSRLVGASIEPTARLAGGANMFATEVARTIGRENVEAAERVCAALGIPVVGRHCGGEKGRRMILDSTTGLITIEIVGQDSIELHDGLRRRKVWHG